jgi:hypothetical protein
MFYKSSILAAIFVLLSMGNAIASLAPEVIAADLSNIENPIVEQPSELIVNSPNLRSATTKNSASIAKSRLLQVPTADTKTATELNVSTDQSSASIAKARLHNLSAKESAAPNSSPVTRSITPKTIQDQIKNTVHTTPSPIVANNTSNIPATANKSIEQNNIASANSELNAIEQWEINKSVTLTDLLLTPAPVQTIVQAPDRLPDSSIPSTVIETQKPFITKPVTPTIGTPKPLKTTTEIQTPAVDPGVSEAIAKPTTPIIETKKPESLKPSPQIIEAQKPESASQDNEPKKWAVGIHTQFSTTGFVGVDAGYKFSPNLHARLGLNTVGFNVDYASQGIDYKARFNPTNVHLLGDFFPFGGGLRLTGGLVFQSNQFNATGTPNSSAIPGGIPTQINLGGNNFNISDVGTVSSEGSFSNSVAPYLGIGFGTPISPGLGFNFDAGVMFAGSANVRLRANIPSSVPAAIQNQIRSSLAEQERRTNNDIGSFGIYPVLSVGISYAF